MNAPEVVFWVVTTVAGVASLAWYVHLRRLERSAPSQSERLSGGGR